MTNNIIPKYKIFKLDEKLNEKDLESCQIFTVPEYNLQVAVTNAILTPNNASSNSKNHSTPTSLLSHQQELLRQQLDQLQAATKSISKVQVESKYKKYIDLLHRYNDIKDVTQALLGKLAEMTQRTMADLHEEFGLDANEGKEKALSL